MKEYIVHNSTSSEMNYDLIAFKFQLQICDASCYTLQVVSQEQADGVHALICIMQQAPSRHISI